MLDVFVFNSFISFSYVFNLSKMILLKTVFISGIVEYGHLDLGAEWIHGQTGNPLYELAVSHNLTHNLPGNVYISPSSASIYDVHEFRTEKGDLIEEHIVSDVSTLMENLYNEVFYSAPRNSSELINEFPTKEIKTNTKTLLVKYSVTH